MCSLVRLSTELGRQAAVPSPVCISCILSITSVCTADRERRLSKPNLSTLKVFVGMLEKDDTTELLPLTISCQMSPAWFVQPSGTMSMPHSEHANREDQFFSGGLEAKANGRPSNYALPHGKDTYGARNRPVYWYCVRCHCLLITWRGSDSSSVVVATVQTVDKYPHRVQHVLMIDVLTVLLNTVESWRTE
jgi:hypothetical protein